VKGLLQLREFPLEASHLRTRLDQALEERVHVAHVHAHGFAKLLAGRARGSRPWGVPHGIEGRDPPRDGIQQLEERVDPLPRDRTGDVTVRAQGAFDRVGEVSDGGLLDDP